MFRPHGFESRRDREAFRAIPYRICDWAGISGFNGVAQSWKRGFSDGCFQDRYPRASRYASVVVMAAKKKNPHAVALGKLAAKVRWKGVPKAERTALARKAGKARWVGLTKAERSELAARGGKASRGKPKTSKKGNDL